MFSKNDMSSWFTDKQPRIKGFFSVCSLFVLREVLQDSPADGWSRMSFTWSDGVENTQPGKHLHDQVFIIVVV